MSRFLAIPLFLFGVLLFSAVGMIAEINFTLGTRPGWNPGKTFAFTLMVIASLFSLALFAGAGYVLVKGIPLWL